MMLVFNEIKADRPLMHDTLNTPWLVITDKQTIPMDW